MDLKDIQKHIDQAVKEMNNRQLDKFEGFSPHDMFYIINKPFDVECPIQFNSLSEEEYKQIPIMKQLLLAVQLIQEAGELKLTQTGALPTKMVTSLCNKEFLMDEALHFTKRTSFKESDSMTAQLTRILLDLMGIIKKRHNKLSLTKNGEKLVSNPQKLFRTTLEKYTTLFNWAYFDYYEDHPVGQMGFLFSVFLVSKYGNQKGNANFYAEKYLNAFPRIIDEIEPRPYSDVIDVFNSSYALRTFDRFMKYLGLVEVEQEKYGEPKYVWKTGFFDRMISIKK